MLFLVTFSCWKFSIWHSTMTILQQMCLSQTSFPRSFNVAKWNWPTKGFPSLSPTLSSSLPPLASITFYHNNEVDSYSTIIRGTAKASLQLFQQQWEQVPNLWTTLIWSRKGQTTLGPKICLAYAKLKSIGHMQWLDHPRSKSIIFQETLILLMSWIFFWKFI